MKLRLRSTADPRRTIRLDLASPATLLDLKSALADSADPRAVKLSLNRRDELVSDDSNASLQSLGVTSGDLMYFTHDPNEFAPPAAAAAPLQIPPEGPSSTSPANSSQPISHSMERRLNTGGDDGESTDLRRESSILEPGSTVSMETLDSNSKLRFRNEDSECGIEAGPMEVEGCSSMETVDGDEKAMADADDELVLVPPGKYVPLPSLLQKVLKDQGEEVKGNDVMLVVMVVHSVFVENGFVGFDSLATKAIEGLGLQQGWAACVTTNSLKLRYTLPSLLSLGSDVVETINLRFQILGKFVTVYGSVPGKNSTIRLSLDGSCYGPSIMFFMREKFSALDGGSSVTSHEKLVFELWKMIKDKLLFPLHINICEKVGLPAPPCFVWLPADLKFYILELLPWMELAKIACVCSEMNYLSSNDDLWKQRYREVFGEVNKAGVRETRWKDKFAANVLRQKKLEADIERRRKAPRKSFYGWLQRPVPFGGGRFIGGDYDLNPGGLGGLFNYGGSRLRPRRFSPHGNLNGSRSPF